MPSRSKQADAVGGHVPQRVRRHRERALEVAGGHGGDEVAEVDRVLVQLRRQAAVAVVVADDVAAAGGEHAAEVGVPAEQLGAEAHHEQDGRVAGVAEGLVLDRDGLAAGVGERDRRLGVRLEAAGSACSSMSGAVSGVVSGLG